MTVNGEDTERPKDHWSWEVVAPLLRLRLRPAGASEILGPRLGCGIQAQIVIQRSDCLIPLTNSILARVDRGGARVAAAAWEQTLLQPIRWSTTSVTSGADVGSQLIVGGGGPCTSGAVAMLDSLFRSYLRFPILLCVPNDQVVVLAALRARSSAEAIQALATRLLAMQRQLDPPSRLATPPHRMLLWCRRGGRLTIFNDEEP